MAPESSRYSVRRIIDLWEELGIGGAPKWPSTTCRCIVFEPTSSTPNLTGEV